uniref:Uncharacterized protein n=1 Tax=Rhizophagus irregularis (strain DAOM 181602 / DAOM 197198 / MUCL 43194) TaxID=747089 RepID=U9SVE9_RHIID
MQFIGINETVTVSPEKGGLVSVNHIPWSNSTEWGYQVGTLSDHPSREKLRDMGVDGFEVINGDTFDWQTYLFVQQNNMLMHIRRNYDRTKGDENKFFIDATGTRPRVYPKKNPAYYNLLPMTLLADYWTSFYSESKGMYSFQSTFCHQRKFVMHWKVIFGLVSGV